ncbi:MAG TPA: gamma-glutamyltransferase, partial [Steroidobacteraceae bacterium]|nr:gamma-glutamyltransferase [Steroidobacteraceae bacterium]
MRKRGLLLLALLACAGTGVCALAEPAPPPPAQAPQPAAEPPAAPSAAPATVPAASGAEQPPPEAPPETPAPAAQPPAGHKLGLFHRHRKGQAWVAAANPLAVQAGLEILAKGGNAIDAAVAVQTMLGLVEPQSSGVAGGAFLMYYDAGSHEVSALDGREKAPAAAPANMFLDEHGKPLPFL